MLFPTNAIVQVLHKHEGKNKTNTLTLGGSDLTDDNHALPKKQLLILRCSWKQWGSTLQVGTKVSLFHGLSVFLWDDGDVLHHRQRSASPASEPNYSEFTSMSVQSLKYRGKTSWTLQNQLLYFLNTSAGITWSKVSVSYVKISQYQQNDIKLNT